MKQIILTNKHSDYLGAQLIEELQKLNNGFVIIHVSSFYDHIEEYFKAVIFYHE